MMAPDVLNDARHEVLAENTAQAVYKHLAKLFSEESRFRKRWVWELLQNARDASPSEGVDVWLIQRSDHLIFRHTGVPFNYKSMAHLIYHGSTKYDLTESGSIGQFGTGFLTTHLISKIVKVKGRTDDGKGFTFDLDRRGDNAEQLGAAMEESWKAFTEALTDRALDMASTFTTEYEYPLANGVRDVVKEGVDDLVANAAYVLAFNERIRSIRLDYPNRSATIEKRDAAQLCDGAQLLHVEERGSREGLRSRYVAIVTNDNGISVAVELAKADGHWSVADLGQSPRIFVAFPLTGTRHFCLPVVVNNEKFQPREDRDTLYFGGENENMRGMEAAFELAAHLALLAAERDWLDAHILVHLNELQEWDWVENRDWLRDVLVTRFIEPLRSSSLLETLSGEKIAPGTGMIPLAVGSARCLDVWDVVTDVSHFSARLPRRDLAEIWAKNLTAWANFLKEKAEDLDESLTLDELCKQVAEWGTVEEVGAQLHEGHDPIKWLNRLHSLIGKAERNELFREIPLIPNQSGAMKKSTELKRDPGIDEGLKDIAESLSLQTRDGLLDLHMCLKDLPELQPWLQEEIVTAAVQKPALSR